MGRRFKTGLYFLFFIGISLLVCHPPQIFAADEDIPGNGIKAPSVEELELINERFQSLSSGLRDMPSPPNLARTIELPNVEDASEVEEEPA
jgi:hypothetical protein